MSRIQEFSASGAASGDTVGVLTVPAGGVPIGASIAIGVATVAPGTISVTDDRGNTYVADGQHLITSATSAVALFHTVVTSALLENDEITVDFDTAVTRWAIQAQHFSEEITSVDTADWGDNGGASTASIDAGTGSSNDTSALYVAAICMLNVGRVFTASNGFTAGTKVQSTVGSGDRAIQMMWKYGSGSQDALATFNTSGQFVGTTIGLGLDSGGDPPAVKEYIIIGGEKIPRSGLFVIIDEEKVAPSGLFVIIDETKVAL